MCNGGISYTGAGMLERSKWDSKVVPALLEEDKNKRLPVHGHLLTLVTAGPPVDDISSLPINFLC